MNTYRRNSVCARLLCVRYPLDVLDKCDVGDASSYLFPKDRSCQAVIGAK